MPKTHLSGSARRKQQTSFRQPGEARGGSNLPGPAMKFREKIEKEVIKRL
jgi:hypothetical protein